MQENELSTQVPNWDKENFIKLYEMHKNEVYYFALKKMGNREDAEEIVQDTFVNVFKKIDTLKDKNAFKPWLYQICHRKCIEMYRKRGRIVEREEEDYKEFENYLVEEDALSLPDVSLLTKEVSEAVLRLVEELPDTQKTTVLLYYFEELSIKEIAEIQECSENTVKGRLLYARKAIKTKIEKTRKKGVSLLSFAPFPLLVIFLKEEALASTLSAEASKTIWNAILETILSSTATASAGIGAATKGAVTATKAGISISTKIIIAVSGVSLAALIGTAAMLNKPDTTVNQPEIITTSSLPSSAEETPNILLDTESTEQEKTVFEPITWGDYAKIYYDFIQEQIIPECGIITNEDIALGEAGFKGDGIAGPFMSTEDIGTNGKIGFADCDMFDLDGDGKPELVTLNLVYNNERGMYIPSYETYKWRTISNNVMNVTKSYKNIFKYKSLFISENTPASEIFVSVYNDIISLVSVFRCKVCGDTGTPMLEIQSVPYWTTEEPIVEINPLFIGIYHKHQRINYYDGRESTYNKENAEYYIQSDHPVEITAEEAKSIFNDLVTNSKGLGVAYNNPDITFTYTAGERLKEYFED